MFLKTVWKNKKLYVKKLYITKICNIMDLPQTQKTFDGS